MKWRMKTGGHHEGPSTPKPDVQPAGQRKPGGQRNPYLMTMRIVATPVLTNFAGVPVRVWKGFLPNMPESQPCEVFVFRIVVHSAEARAKLQELIPIAVPVPLHQVFDELEAQGKECEPYGAI